MCKSNRYLIVSYVLVFKVLIELINGSTIYSWKSSSNFVFKDEPVSFIVFILFEIFILVYLIKKLKEK